jgi:Icc protein
LPCRFSSTADNGSVLLVQLTDSHLFDDVDGRLLGMLTQDSLERVIDLVRREQPQIEMLLVTGDISQDGSPASYARFRQMSAALAAPARWICGNHDHWPAIRRVCAGSDLLEPVVDIGNWRVTLLDSSIAGAVQGQLSPPQLALLERSLSEAPERYHLICLHHHPVEIQCRWLDDISLRNGDQLFAMLERFPRTRGVLWGHVHQEVDRKRGNLRLLGAPSTCVQFTPQSEGFQVDGTAPGYRWLRLHADGRLETGVSRLDPFVFAPDYGARGY